MPESQSTPSESVTSMIDGHQQPLSQARTNSLQRRETVRWWLMFFGQPLLFFTIVAIAVAIIGVGQRTGILPGGKSDPNAVSDSATATKYVCPMMCTPPLSEPGNCPVCGMELVPATSTVGTGDGTVIIDTAARRIANIETTLVEERSFVEQVHASGKIEFDEGRVKLVSAHVDGRLDDVYADFTGIEVTAKQPLALLYAPQLYADMAIMLQASREIESPQFSDAYRQQQESLLANAKTRLHELGMTSAQIEAVVQQDEVNSRVELLSPISGTVLERFGVEGEYIKAGQPLYKIADLSLVWLTLELFPDEASRIRYGQKVTATTKSNEGGTFIGRVAFVEPIVDEQTRTVGVRVVLENQDRKLRVGEFAAATINLPFHSPLGNNRKIYDPELAGKWISPSHPQIVRDEPGTCPLCDQPLVLASDLGFSETPIDNSVQVVVPSRAILNAANTSVVYVEVEPGRFSLRHVKTGPTSNGETVIVDGLQKGESVAVAGNFLIDSQMQLAGNPSLIDPAKRIHQSMDPTPRRDLTDSMREKIAKLPTDDAQVALEQQLCPVTDMPLGSMGVPIRVDIEGQTVFICCESCRQRLQAQPSLRLKYSTNQDPAKDKAVD